MIQIKRSIESGEPALLQRQAGDMEYLVFPLLERSEVINHLFTTRLGGVSQGIYSSMNLSFSQGDDPEKVLENYRIVAAAMGVSVERMVTSQQTHTANIRLVTSDDCGKGVVRPRDYQDVDGLITAEPGIVLVTSYADCVPLYFVDPVKKVIGLAHSGWRGTVQRIGARMVAEMERAFGSRPKDLLAAVGPSICRDCYEVGEDVAEQFAELEREAAKAVKNASTECPAPGSRGGHVVNPGKMDGKYQLDLWLANRLILEQAGIPEEQIAVTDICTCHNPDYLFSHRASQGQRGAMCAFMSLRES